MIIIDLKNLRAIKDLYTLSRKAWLDSLHLQEALTDDFILYQEQNGATYVPPPKGGYEVRGVSASLDFSRSLYGANGS